MSLATGTRLGSYEILAPLGAGGMGDVYRARDRKLDRDVAIKVLSESLARNPDALARFEREAKAVAALSHPNILAIHDFGSDAGVSYAVTELLEGRTLRDRLDAGPIPLEQALDYALQITRGLSAAHEKGIVHRDLKPEDLFVTDDEHLKILDFGLAKRTEEETPGDETSAPTVLRQTQPGTVMGTAGYMSPEQVRGRPVDLRSDLFSSGAVLYELVSGRRAFRRDSAADTMSAILRDEPPPLSASDPPVPDALADVVRRCLEKEPARRYQKASEISADLRRLVRGDRPAASAPGDGSRPAESRPAGVRSERSAVGSGGRRLLRGGLIAAAAALALAVGSFWIGSRRAPKLTSRDTIVIADFANSTGESAFDGSLRQALTIQLEQSPYLKLLSAQSVRSTLKLMNRPPDAPLNAEAAREVCQRSNCKAVVSGTIDRIGSHYLIGLRALDAQSGDALASAEAEATGRDDVLRRLAGAANDVRTRLGETLASVQRHSTPLGQATTSSLDALKAYTEGVRVQWTQGDAASIPFHRRAVELDPEFARAYATLGMALSNVGRTDEASENFTKAFRLRSRVSDAERFYIEATYYGYVTGELEKSNDVYRQWIAVYPEVTTPYVNMAVNLMLMGRYDLAADGLRKAIRVNAESGGGLLNLVECEVSLGRLDEAKTLFAQSVSRFPGSRFLHLQGYEIGFLLRDDALMQQQLDWARGRPGDEAALLWAHSETAASRGREAEARALAESAVRQAKAAENAEQAAQMTAWLGLREADLGNDATARRRAPEALAIRDGRDERVAASLLLVRAGDAAGGLKIADGLDRQFPADTILQNYWLPTIRASAALAAHRPEEALAALERTRPYETGDQGWGLLYPIYVRGLADLAAKRPEPAAAEFGRMLANPGILRNSLLRPLAELQRARARRMSGDVEAARTGYRAFLDAWAGADGDLTALKEAKAELAALPRP